MNIKQLTEILKKKLEKEILCENIKIEDKSFLHKNHITNDINKFHIKLTIKSDDLKLLNKIQSTKKIYGILKKELKENIHSIQILIN